MQKIKFIRYLFLLCLSLSVFGLSAQVLVNEDFDAGTPAGWTDSYSNTSTQTCAGNSERDNLYSSSTTGDLTSPNYIGASNGTDLTVSFDYKVVDWSAATVATSAGWGSADLQYSTDDGTNWTTILTIDDNNHIVANTCANMMAIIPSASLPTGSDVKLRIANTWTSGDYYFYIDNFAANQVLACVQPAATATIVTDCANNQFSIDVNVTNLGDGTPAINDGTTTTPVTTTGVITVGPYASGSSITLILEHGSDTQCDIALGNFGFSCPPTNDLCNNATVVSCGTTITGESTAGATGGSGTSCVGSQGDNIWYTFVGTGDNWIIDLNASTEEGQVDIYESTDGTCATIACATGSAGSGGNPVQASIITTAGTTYYISVGNWINGDPAVDYDISFTCVCPTPPAFTLSDGGNSCPTQEFFIDVDITNLNGATTINILNDAGVVAVNGVDGSATPYNIGPFLAGTTVTVTVEDANDASCSTTSVFTTPVACPTTCAPTTSATLVCGSSVADDTSINGVTNTGIAGCAATDPSTAPGIWYEFIGTGQVITVDLTADYDGELDVFTCTGTAFTCVAGDDDGGTAPIDETVTFTTVSGTSYYILVHGHAAAAGSFTALDITCTCAPPTATLTVDGSDCANNNYSIDVNLTSVGTGGATVDITTSDAGASTETAVGAGMYTLTGLTSASGTVTVTIDSGDPACVFTQNIDIPTACPPANDLCGNAIPATVNPSGTGCAAPIITTNDQATDSGELPVPSCGSYSGGDTWYSITVPANGELVIIYDSGAWSSFAATVYTGSCGTLVEDGCIVNFGTGSETLTGLTPGSAILRVFDFLNDDTGTANFCLEETPDPCATSTLAATATATDMTCAGMDGTATVTVTGGDGTYTYLWDDGGAQTTATATGLVANTYTVVVTETSSGCTATAMATVADGCAANPCIDGYETGGGNQLTGMLDMNADYETDQGIDSDQIIGMTTPTIGVDYDAAIDIDLLPGFEVKLGVEFDAFIDGCQGGSDTGAGGNQ